MAIDLKYGRVTLEHGDIGEDEPIVVFRGRDAGLVPLLGAYRTWCAQNGSPDHHLDLIVQRGLEIQAWQREHETRIPNSDAYIARLANQD